MGEFNMELNGDLQGFALTVGPLYGRSEETFNQIRKFSKQK